MCLGQSTDFTQATYFPRELAQTQTEEGNSCLILAPNTELAGQIFDVTKQWAKEYSRCSDTTLSGF